ncbi:MAG: hypothetical protein ACI9XC_000349 [Gammaproteobacteria bacterium]|jgi:hypothetical protein
MKWLFLSFIVIANNSYGYETLTHSEISNESIRQSILSQDPELLISLGVILDAGVNEEIFPSIVPTDPNGSDPNNSIFLEKTSIVRILTGGSVLEDAGFRSAHHFYDPQNGGLGVNVGLPSPDWILESLILPVNGEEINISFGNQNFSYNDANDYYFRALTLPDEESRLVNIGLMFRSLGHVIHHLQDMAQPQHVRSDGHCDATNDFPSLAFFCFLVGKHKPSYYEKYTNTRINNIPISTATSEIPQFASARDFWENADGNGMAEYTSRNFVSDGTNYQGDNDAKLTHHPSFPNPVPLTTVIPVSLASLLTEDHVMSQEQKNLLLLRLGCNVDIDNNCIVDFIQNQVIDNEGLTDVNTRSSTLSFLDEELRLRNIKITNLFLGTIISKRLVSLNRFNFDAGYPFLLPRAIAYSAGLINHFFRGRIDVERLEWIDDKKFKASIKNISDEKNSLKIGQFEIFYDSKNGLRMLAKNFSLFGNNLPIDSGESINLTLELPDDLDDTIDEPYVLVFNGIEGKIGEDSGIATTRFSQPPVGKVQKIMKIEEGCPTDSILSVKINFDGQPENNGQVIIQGLSSDTTFDFRAIPQGVEVIIDQSIRSHGIDLATGSYFYKVVNQQPDLILGPCAYPFLGSWVEGEGVIGLSSL